VRAAQGVKSSKQRGVNLEQWTHVGRLDALPLDAAKRVLLPTGEALAVLRLPDDRVVAVGDACCHKTASLCRGDIEDLGPAVAAAVGDGSAAGGLCLRCPKHRKKFAGGLYFNVHSGAAVVKAPCDKFNAGWRLPVHDTMVLDEVAPRRRPSTAVPGRAGEDTAVKFVYVRNVPKATGSAGAGAATAAGTAAAAGKDDDDEGEGGVPWVLAARVAVNHDSVVLRLARGAGAGAGAEGAALASTPTVRLDAWHVSVGAVVEGQAAPVVRDYTPLSSVEEYMGGTLDLLVKVYC
jgi:nitrite reductase/ring-hydroxylating ferredoxin subunit